MKTRDVVALIREEVGPVGENNAQVWARRFIGPRQEKQGSPKRGRPPAAREWSEREIVAFYAYHAVKRIGGSGGKFQTRTARAILMGLPLAGALWSNGTRYVACEPSEASERVFSEGGWALPIGKWRMRVRRAMLKAGSPKAPQNGWNDIVRESLERQEIEKAIQRHPSSLDPTWELEHE